MKLKIFILFALISNTLICQELKNINYETEFYDTVDNWIVLPKAQNDSIYNYGFMYIDIHAGITFHYGGNFYFDKNGKLVNKKSEEYQMLKQRLNKPNNMKVHILSENELKKLELDLKPNWLKIYSYDKNKIENLVSEGNFFNHVGACKSALISLEKAYKINPHFEGLEFELSYSYNYLGEFKKAIPILESAIKNDPNNSLFYKELGFAYVKNNQIELAEKAYSKGIEISKSNFEKSEMAVNMTQGYFQIKNKKKYDEWAAKTRQFAEKDNPFLPYLEYFEKNWDMKRE